MKRYIIKPEYIDLFGSDANAYTVITTEDIKRLSEAWEKPIEDIMEYLIEDNTENKAYRVMCRIPGKHDWQVLNRLIELETGCTYCETEEEYNEAVRNGFITYDCYYTTVWIDD